MCTALLSKVSLKFYQVRKGIKFVIRIDSARNIGGGGRGDPGVRLCYNLFWIELIPFFIRD